MKCAAAKTRSSFVIMTLKSPLGPIYPRNLLGSTPGGFARRDSPDLVRQPFQPLLSIVQLGRSHRLGASRDIARMAEQLVQHLAERPVPPALCYGRRRVRRWCRGLLAAGRHAVWIPMARSSAWRTSSTVARTVAAAPCSLK